MDKTLFLSLHCADSLKPKIRYVVETFAAVLGRGVVETEAPLPDGAPGVWYGSPAEAPSLPAGWAGFHAAPDAPAFFAGDQPRRAGEVHFARWGRRRIPFLFPPHPADPAASQLLPWLACDAPGRHFPWDVLASAFYFLSNREELLIPDRDRHGRFPYALSLAAQLRLEKPIVDVYLDLFIALLNRAAGGSRPPLEIPPWATGVPFVVCLTHDVDEVRKPFLSRLKFTCRHLLRPANGHRRTPLGQRARFALKTLADRRDPYWTFPTFLAWEKQFGCTASYFFQAGGRIGRRHYRLTEPPVRHFLSDLLAAGFEVGLHGTYHAAFDEGRFVQERDTLAAVAGRPPLGHRQHYLRMDYVATLPLYERAGFCYDTTLGYADHEGYRNQFSYPFHPYCHAADRPFQFWELPTVLMDVTLGGYRHLPAAAAWEVMEDWLDYARQRRGCLTVLWHNVWDGEYPGYFDLYRRLLEWIAGHGGAGQAGWEIVQRWQKRLRR